MNYLSNKIKILSVLSFAVIFGVTGCDSDLTNSSGSSSTEGLSAAQNQQQVSQLSDEEISEETNQRAEELLAYAEEHGYDLKAANKKLAELTSHTSDNQMYQNIVNTAIDGGQFQCGPTPLNEWANANVGYANLNDALFIILNGIDQMPILYSLVFENERNPRQTYGYNGEYTRQIFRADRGVSRFWDVNLRDVQTVSAHGSMLSEFDKVFQIVEVLYPTYTEESNADFAQQIVDLVTQEPLYNNGDAPLFSFNAVAYSGGAYTVNGEDGPPNVIMGDGILDGMDAIGLGDAAPEAILAHEMGHQVQYQLNVFEEDTISNPAESTRRTELMADAYSAYYLGHKRGAAFNWDRVETFMRADFNVGDCSFESSGHHGTPNQRLKAAQWGFDLAENAPRRVGIISASDFVDAFDEALPEIVAPDAEGS